MSVEHNEPTLFIGPHFSAHTVAALIKSNGLVLWDNEGMWGLLTRVHLQRLLEQWEMAQAHNAAYPRTPFEGIGLSFINVIQVSSEVARALRLSGR